MDKIQYSNEKKCRCSFLQLMSSSLSECTAVTMSGVAKEGDESASCLLASCDFPGCTLVRDTFFLK